MRGAIVVHNRTANFAMGAIHNWRYQFLFIHFHQSPSPKSTLFRANVCKVEKILKGSLDWIPSPSHSEKIQIMGGKVCLRCKTLLGIINKHLKKKSLLTSPSNVLPYTSSKLSRPSFEFSLKVKVMGLNPGYLSKSFLLYFHFSAVNPKEKIAKTKKKHL